MPISSQVLPKDYSLLLALIRKMRDVVPPEQLLPVAEAIERDHMARLEELPERLEMLADIYRLNGMYDKALRLLSLAATKKSEYYFHLYDISFREELTILPAEREEYLNKFIAGGAEGPSLDDTAPRPDYTRAEAYSCAIRCLNHAGRHQECLALIARYHEDQSFQRGVKGPVSILLTKARCLDKLGDKSAALAAYRTFKEKSANFGGPYARSRERVEQRIQKLAQE